MIAHSLLAQVGNLAVILLTVLLSTSVHYLFLQHLNHGSTLAIRFPQIRLGYGVSGGAFFRSRAVCYGVQDIPQLRFRLARGQLRRLDRRLPLPLLRRPYHGGLWGHRAHRAGSFACQNGSANGIRFNHLDRVIPIS